MSTNKSTYLKEQLKRQLGFLESSCTHYDAGNKDEAIRIAGALRTLFHSKGRIKSVLAQLKQPGVKLLSTCNDIPPGAKFYPNLTVIKLSPVLEMAEYAPKLETAETKRFIVLSRWWWDEIVYIINDLIIMRKDLILAAAEKDGYSHVDAKFDPYYEILLNGAGWKMTLNPPTGASKEFPFKYGHLAALRQMGYEVLNSPDITKLAE